jgi:WD40 repeat protein
LRTKIEIQKLYTYLGHRDSIYTLKTPNDKTHFYSAGGEGFLVNWSVNEPDNGHLIAKVNNSIFAIDFVNNYTQMLIGQNFEGIHLIDLKTKKEIQNLKLENSYIFDIKVIDNLAVVALGNGNIYWIDIDKNSILHKTCNTDKSARTIAYNPLLKEIAIGYSDFSIRIYDIETKDLKNSWIAHKNSVFTLQYSHDFQYLLSAGRDAQLKVWNCWNHYELANHIPAHLFAINHISMSPDGKLFATGSMDKSVKLWDSQTFALLKVLDKSRHAGHGTSVNRLLWLDNRHLLSAGDDKIVNLWKIDIQSI